MLILSWLEEVHSYIGIRMGIVGLCERNCATERGRCWETWEVWQNGCNIIKCDMEEG